MSKQTDYLNLFKWDLSNETDKKSKFDIQKALNDNWDKLDKELKSNKTDKDNIKDDIKEINDNIDKVKKDVENKIETQEDLISRLRDNMISVDTDEATSIHVTDASNLPAKLDVKGNDYQYQQEGTDNLAVLTEGTIEQDGITIVIKDGVGTATGTNSKSETTFIPIGTAYLFKGQKYYCETHKTSGGMSLRLNNETIWFDDHEETAITPSSTGEAIIRFSKAANTESNVKNIDCRISKTSGATWVQGKKTIPSLEYPSKIEVVDNVKVIQRGLNLLNFNNLKVSGSDVTFKNDVLTVKSKGTTGYNFAFAYITDIVKSNPGKTLCFTYSKIDFSNFNASQSTVVVQIETKDKEDKSTYTTVLSKNNSANYTIPNNSDEITEARIKFYANNNSTYIDSTIVVEKPMLVLKTDKDKQYERYKEQEYTLTVQKPMLKGDYFIKEDDTWKEVHLREKKNIKDDISKAQMADTGKHIFISLLLKDTAKIPSTSSEDMNVISNILSHASYQDIDNKNVDYGIGISTQGSLDILIKNFTTVDEYKEYLNNDDFYYYYYLATPKKLTCTDTQKKALEQLQNLELFKGTNNIVTSEDLALLKMNYIVDTKSYIDSKLK